MKRVAEELSRVGCADEIPKLQSRIESCIGVLGRNAYSRWYNYFRTKGVDWKLVKEDVTATLTREQLEDFSTNSQRLQRAYTNSFNGAIRKKCTSINGTAKERHPGCVSIHSSLLVDTLKHTKGCCYCGDALYSYKAMKHMYKYNPGLFKKLKLKITAEHVRSFSECNNDPLAWHTVENIEFACWDCNSLKGDTPHKEFKKRSKKAIWHIKTVKSGSKSCRKFYEPGEYYTVRTSKVARTLVLVK